MLQLLAEEGNLRMVHRELHPGDTLRSPLVLGCMGVVQVHGKWAVVMERMRCSLQDELHARGEELQSGDALPQQLRWALQVVMAVRLLHSAGMVHRDIKSSNFLLHDCGLAAQELFLLSFVCSPLPTLCIPLPDGRLVVSDFGSVKLPDLLSSTLHALGL